MPNSAYNSRGIAIVHCADVFLFEPFYICVFRQSLIECLKFLHCLAMEHLLCTFCTCEQLKRVLAVKNWTEQIFLLQCKLGL